MNTQELERAIQATGMPRSMYSLHGGLPNEAYCLHQSEHAWEVYYSEHGQKSDLQTFATEEQACRHLLDEISYTMERRRADATPTSLWRRLLGF